MKNERKAEVRRDSTNKKVENKKEQKRKAEVRKDSENRKKHSNLKLKLIFAVVKEVYKFHSFLIPQKG